MWNIRFFKSCLEGGYCLFLKEIFLLCFNTLLSLCDLILLQKVFEVPVQFSQNWRGISFIACLKYYISLVKEFSAPWLPKYWIITFLTLSQSRWPYLLISWKCHEILERCEHCYSKCKKYGGNIRTFIKFMWISFKML